MIDLDFIRRTNPMFDEHSVKYENLLCHIYGYPEKNIRHGAAHEFFDEMMSSSYIDDDGDYEDAFAAGLAIGKVATYLSEAFQHAIDECDISQETVAGLVECQDALSSLDPITIEGIKQVVAKAYTVLGLD